MPRKKKTHQTDPNGVRDFRHADARRPNNPPAGSANFAWVQHINHHLAPAGVAGFVLANGPMSSNQSGEGEMTDPQHLLEV